MNILLKDIVSRTFQLVFNVLNTIIKYLQKHKDIF